MNTIMKKENGNQSPVRSFSGLVDQFFQNNLSRLWDDDSWGLINLNRQANIPVNIKETDQSFEMEVVAPGLKKEDFKVQVSGDILTVSFEHKEQQNQENKQEGWLRKEYKRQSFMRSFGLDDGVDANKIQAKYVDGILHLSLPKKEGARKLSRTIDIS